MQIIFYMLFLFYFSYSEHHCIISKYGNKYCKTVEFLSQMLSLTVFYLKLTLQGLTMIWIVNQLMLLTDYRV